MNILYLAYTDLSYNGRTKELIDVCRRMGNVKAIVINGEIPNVIIKKTVSSGLIGFLKYICVCMRKTTKDVDVVFVDNRMACVPGLLLKFIYPRKIYIQDARELYLYSEQKRIKSKIGCLFEKHMLRKSNIVICANQYRAELMQKEYSLVNPPLVYENIRRLHGDSDAVENEYVQSLRKDAVKIISTSGWEIIRTNDNLAEAVSHINDFAIDLVFVGGGTDEDRSIIERKLKNNSKHRLLFIDKVKSNVLKSIIDACDIGVVNYGKYDTNNLYCASGKIYEFIFEGKPVITTSNPPLKEFCDKYKVGASFESYIESIIEVVNNYKFYKDNVEDLRTKLDIDQNNQILASNILDALRQ